jgi:hypothetical protein
MSQSTKKQILINLIKTRQVRDAIRAKVQEFIKKSAGGKLAALDFSLKANAEILRGLNIPDLVTACPVGLATQAHVSLAAVAERRVIKEAAAAESAVLRAFGQVGTHFAILVRSLERPPLDTAAALL